MIKDERGSAMLMTVIVTAVLLWVGISLLHQTLGETINTARHTDSIVVSEIALSGLEVGVALLQTNNALRTNGSPLTGNIGEGSFETQIIEQDNRIRIYSTGYLSGITKTVISEVSISAGVGRYAIVADSLIGITGSVDIDGDITLNSPGGLVSLFGSADIYGNIYIPHGDDLEAALGNSPGNLPISMGR
ncbi:hypothetical protein LR013_04745 [candidate division NPL-UPA2 bacterium]|nr:hypothetical protein [candidate division NPL-UPA2 bacterium]